MTLTRLEFHTPTFAWSLVCFFKLPTFGKIEWIFFFFLNGAQTNQIKIELAHYKDRKQKYTLNYGTVHYIQTLVASRVCQLCKKYRVDAIETNCLCCCSAARFCPPANVCCRSYCVPLALVDFFCLTSMAELTTSTLKHHFFPPSITIFYFLFWWRPQIYQWGLTLRSSGERGLLCYLPAMNCVFERFPAWWCAEPLKQLLWFLVRHQVGCSRSGVPSRGTAGPKSRGLSVLLHLLWTSPKEAL